MSRPGDIPVERRYGMKLKECRGCGDNVPDDEMERCDGCSIKFCPDCHDAHECETDGDDD